MNGTHCEMVKGSPGRGSGAVTRERRAIQRKEDEIMKVNMWNERDALAEARPVYVAGRAGMQCSYWAEERPCDSLK